MVHLRVALAGLGLLVAASPAFPQNLTPEQELANLSPAAKRLIEQRVSAGKRRAKAPPVAVVAEPVVAVAPTVTEAVEVVIPRDFNILQEHAVGSQSFRRGATGPHRKPGSGGTRQHQPLCGADAAAPAELDGYRHWFHVRRPPTTQLAQSCPTPMIASRPTRTGRCAALQAPSTARWSMRPAYHQSYGVYVTMNRAILLSASCGEE